MNAWTWPNSTDINPIYAARASATPPLYQLVLGVRR
jgi:hypothetical protein